MNIDLVVPWVDGSDIEYTETKNEYKKLLGKDIDSEAIIKARFQDNGELKYLLRSIEQNAKFIRYIFLVTNGQIPKWLNINNPKIKIINHKQIMPESSLPTFNSNAIEACIANIENLSDHFLYSNDDFFIAKPVTEKDFFTKEGYPIIRLKQNYHPEKRYSTLYDKQMIFTSKCFYDKFKIKMNFFEHHNIDAFYKPDVLKCIKEFKTEFDYVTNCKFRKAETLSKMIWSFYSYYLGHSVIKNNWIYKIPIFLRCISKIFVKFFRDSKMIGYQEKSYKMQKNIKLFCINDNEVTTDDDIKRGLKFLEKLFPNKSSFEI